MPTVTSLAWREADSLKLSLAEAPNGLSRDLLWRAAGIVKAQGARVYPPDYGLADVLVDLLEALDAAASERGVSQGDIRAAREILIKWSYGRIKGPTS